MFDNATAKLQVQFASYGINAAQYAAELLQPQLVEESTWKGLTMVRLIKDMDTKYGVNTTY